MNKRNMKYVLSFLGTCLFLVFAVGTMESEEIAEKKVQKEEPALSISAVQLYADYQANEVAADQKYKDKVLIITGTVDDIGKDILDTIYVTLKTNDLIGSVQCFFSDKYADEAAQLRKGQKITVKGKCDGLLMNVLVRGCVIE